jgi:hypothetical protein
MESDYTPEVRVSNMLNAVERIRGGIDLADNVCTKAKSCVEGKLTKVCCQHFESPSDLVAIPLKPVFSIHHFGIRVRLFRPV